MRISSESKPIRGGDMTDREEFLSYTLPNQDEDAAEMDEADAAYHVRMR